MRYRAALMTPLCTVVAVAAKSLAAKTVVVFLLYPFVLVPLVQFYMERTAERVFSPTENAR